MNLVLIGTKILEVSDARAYAAHGVRNDRTFANRHRPRPQNKDYSYSKHVLRVLLCLYTSFECFSTTGKHTTSLYIRTLHGKVFAHVCICTFALLILGQCVPCGQPKKKCAWEGNLGCGLRFVLSRTRHDFAVARAEKCKGCPHTCSDMEPPIPSVAECRNCAFPPRQPANRYPDLAKASIPPCRCGMSPSCLNRSSNSRRRGLPEACTAQMCAHSILRRRNGIAQQTLLKS
jgi:hypothetical protein